MNKIIGVYCEITSKCNQKCPYCFNGDNINMGFELSVDLISNIADKLNQLSLPHITLSGGEPFLHDNIFELLKILEEKNIEISIISNGKCFDKNNLFILQRFQPKLQITFDGYDSVTHDATRGTGNFNHIVSGIKSSRNNGFHGSIGIRINIHKLNYNFIEMILDMLIHEFNVNKQDKSLINTVYIALVHSNSKIDNTFTLQRAEYESLPNIIDNWNKKQISVDSITAAYEFMNPDIGCPYNNEMGTIDCGIKIDSEGDVFPCQLFSDKKFCIGNINENNLDCIIQSKEMNDFILIIRERKLINKNCVKCGYKFLCGCGCPAKAFIEYKDINSPQLCPIRKETFNSMLKEIIREGNK